MGEEKVEEDSEQRTPFDLLLAIVLKFVEMRMDCRLL